MMKKSSKIVSLLLAVLMTVSCLTGLSFASVAAADDNTINFRVPSEWKEAGEILAVYCHMYHIYGDDKDFVHPAWENKYEKASYDAEAGIATFTDTDIYDKKGALVHSQLKDGNDYGVLFVCVYKDTTIADKQTGNVLLSTECYGGTIYVTGNMTENTEDSSKMDAEAKWEDERLQANYGPVLGITSTGKIVNDYLPANMPKALPIAQFIGNYAKSELNGKYVTPETVQGIMNDSRFQVSAKDVMDVYASYYEDNLKGPYVNCKTKDCGTHVFAAKFAEDYDGTNTEGWTTKEWNNYLKTCVCPNCEKKESLSFEDTVIGLDKVAELVGYVEEPDTTEEPTTEEPTTEEPTTEEPTTEEPTTEEPTTEEPTTEEPTTEEPTTEEPTTEEPTTEEPTTEEPTTFEGLVYGDANLDGKINIDDATLVQKAGISLVTLTEDQEKVANVNPDEDDIINIIDVTYIQKWIAGGYTKTAKVGMPYEEQVDTYVVAGSPEVFGAEWDGTAEANTMTEEDGIYTLTLSDVQPFNNAQFKIVKNGTEWIGPEIGNFSFNVVEACDVTITFNPETLEVEVTGTGVTEVELIIDSVRAVGNGGAGWLNDVVWDPADDANLMTEVSDGVYQLVMTDVEANMSAQVKFATNGSWSDSWGGVFAGFDVETEAVYNGDNIEVKIGESDEDENLYTVTLTLDLSAFDYASKTGAKFTVSQQVQADEPETTVEETTVEETTVEETTVEETTVEETTVEETTVEETTVEETTNPDDPDPTTDTYIVAGSPEVFGAEWDGTEVANMMTDEDGDGIYTLTLTDAQPFNNAQFKIVKNGTEWIGPEIGNFSFNVVEACDVTITFNPETLEVEVTGTGVTEVELIIDSVRAVGNGGAGWLNDVVWDPADDANLMTEVSDGVYQLVMTDVEANMKAQVKFATNGTWSDSWGGEFAGFDVETEAVYNGEDIKVSIGESDEDENLYTVTLTLDLSAFDYASKTGAKFTISQQVQADEPETTVEETTVEETTVEETTVEETTVEETTVEETTVEETTVEETTNPDDPDPTTDTYIVAGSPEVFGAEWVGTEVANMMTDEDGDGIYTLILKDVQPFKNAQFKIVKNGTEWIGPKIGNFSFNVVEACDVTITFNPETLEVEVTGTGVTEVELIIDSVRAVGNGGAGWLNDVNWDPAADENLMKEISDRVYQLVMTDVEANMKAQVKFATNGTWSDSWGGEFAGFDVETEAVYNGEDIKASIGESDEDENLYTVTLTLDLSAFDYATKTGAKFTISQQVQGDVPETTSEVEETTGEVEETTAPVEETTAPVEETTAPAPEKVFDSVGLIGYVNGQGGWGEESYELEYADGVWSVVIEFTGGNNQFKARVNDGWNTETDKSHPDFGNAEGKDFSEILTGTYKISVADGAESGTPLTFELVEVAE